MMLIWMDGAERERPRDGSQMWIFWVTEKESDKVYA